MPVLKALSPMRTTTREFSAVRVVAVGVAVAEGVPVPLPVVDAVRVPVPLALRVEEAVDDTVAAAVPDAV